MFTASESPGAIVVAVKFDAAAPNLVRAAQALSRQRGAALHLVHVHSTELPAHTSAYSGVAGIPDSAVDLLDDPRESTGAGPAAYTPSDPSLANGGLTILESTKARLQDMLSHFTRNGGNSHISVLVGNFPDTLIEFASSLKASLIVTGAATENPGFLRSKLRRTFRLMARTPLPALVLQDRSHSLDLERRPLRILLADDLSSANLPVIASVRTFLRLLKIPVDLLHLHIEPQSLGSSVGLTGHTSELWPGISVRERLINDHQEQLKDMLNERARGLKPQIEALGGRYSVGVWRGRVSEELRRAVKIHAADLSVFGQHQAVHTEPLALGQVPFAKMLGIDSAVLVAPR